MRGTVNKTKFQEEIVVLDLPFAENLSGHIAISVIDFFSSPGAGITHALCRDWKSSVCV